MLVFSPIMHILWNDFLYPDRKVETSMFIYYFISLMFCKNALDNVNILHLIPKFNTEIDF